MPTNDYNDNNDNNLFTKTKIQMETIQSEIEGGSQEYVITFQSSDLTYTHLS